MADPTVVDSPVVDAPVVGPRVVTLLLNYRGAAMTVECLRQLRAATPETHPVLLMDNGSGAADVALLEAGAAEDPDVELALFDTNRGYCAAMNHGLRWARDRGAGFVLFLNNDVTVEPGFLGPLLQVLHNDETLAGVGPTILRDDGQVWSQGGEIGFFPNLNRLRGEGRAAAGRDAGPEAVDYLPGACVVYRLDDLEAVQNLDERYFMYFEDALVGHALGERGRKLVWLPWVQVIHAASASSGGGRSPLRKYMSAVNSLRFLREHFQLRLLAAFALFDCALLPLAYAGGMRAGWAKTVGIWDGVRGHQVTEADVSRWLRS